MSGREDPKARDPSRTPVRCIAALAFLAIEHLAESARAAFGCRHPRPIRKRRLMAHVLVVPALELGHPMLIGVAMIADDTLLHAAIKRRGAWQRRMRRCRPGHHSSRI